MWKGDYLAWVLTQFAFTQIIVSSQETDGRGRINKETAKTYQSIILNIHIVEITLACLSGTRSGQIKAVAVQLDRLFQNNKFLAKRTCKAN